MTKWTGMWWWSKGKMDVTEPSNMCLIAPKTDLMISYRHKYIIITINSKVIYTSLVWLHLPLLVFKLILELWWSKPVWWSSFMTRVTGLCWWFYNIHDFMLNGWRWPVVNHFWLWTSSSQSRLYPRPWPVDMYSPCSFSIWNGICNRSFYSLCFLISLTFRV